MKPEYIKIYSDDLCEEIYATLKSNVNWKREKGVPRCEAFFALDHPTTYCYDTWKGERCYESDKFPEFVWEIMAGLNGYGVSYNSYNVCFLNRYEDGSDNLGWHSDDSPGMDLDHPIAVVSFGTPRHIYWKHKDVKGELPEENKVLLEPGSLFIMPAGFQREHIHKIPKYGGNDKGDRISLTFRRFDKSLI